MVIVVDRVPTHLKEIGAEAGVGHTHRPTASPPDRSTVMEPLFVPFFASVIELLRVLLYDYGIQLKASI